MNYHPVGVCLLLKKPLGIVSFRSGQVFFFLLIDLISLCFSVSASASSNGWGDTTSSTEASGDGGNQWGSWSNTQSPEKSSGWGASTVPSNTWEPKAPVIRSVTSIENDIYMCVFQFNYFIITDRKIKTNSNSPSGWASPQPLTGGSGASNER